MRPHDSRKLPSEESDADSCDALPEYRLNSAWLLSEWAIRADSSRDFFSPSGRLFFQEKTGRLRIVDLFTGNPLLIEYPKILRSFEYLPLTDFAGILHGDGRFIRAELDLKNGQIIVDLETEEQIPEDLFTRLSDQAFAFVAQTAGPESELIQIRQLNAKTDAEKWIQIRNGDFDLDCTVAAMLLAGDSLFVVTTADYEPIMCYNLNTKAWKCLEIEGIHRYELPKRDYFWLNGLIFSHHSVRSDHWSFLVIEPEAQESYLLHADFPTCSQGPGVVSATEFGIMGVVVDTDWDRGLHVYQAHLMNIQ